MNTATKLLAIVLTALAAGIAFEAGTRLLGERSVMVVHEVRHWVCTRDTYGAPCVPAEGVGDAVYWD